MDQGGATITNQSSEIEISINNMVVVKGPDKVEGSGDNIDSPLCGRLYKEKDGYIVTWSVTYPDAKIN